LTNEEERKFDMVQFLLISTIVYLYVVRYRNNYTILTRIPIRLKVAITNINKSNESP